MHPFLSIVIPAYKESAKIVRDLEAACWFLEENNIDGEIVVVDDGSPDDTYARVVECAVKYPYIRPFRYEENRGKGYALRYGIAQTRGRFVMFADAGLCVPYDNVLRGLELLRDGDCEMAHGSRATDQAVIRRAQPLYRRVGSKVFWLMLKCFMGIPDGIQDTQCGFKVYKGDVARGLYGACRTDGFMIDIELIRRATRRGWRIKEFPVEWSDDPDTRFHPIWGMIRNFRELFKIRMMT